MSTLDEVRNQLKLILQLGESFDSAGSDTGLLGEIPELDSMAIVSVLTALEEAFEIEFEDDDISGEDFATIGTLVRLVEAKLSN